ncbi:MAG: GAF domain-containing protein [Pseudomonadota bacterium]
MSEVRKDSPQALDAHALAQELDRARRYQRAVGDILRVINQSPGDRQLVFETIVEACRQLFGEVTVGLTIVEGESFAGKAFAGPRGPRPFDKLPFAETIDRNSANGLCILEGKTQRFRDFREHLVAVPGLVVAVELGYYSGIYVPVKTDEAVVGVLNILRQEVCEFSDEDIALGEVFAAQAAIAFENARSFKEMKIAIERERAIADVLRAINRSPGDTKPVFKKIVASCQRLFEGASVGLTIVDGDRFSLTAHANADGEVLFEPESVSEPIDRAHANGVCILDKRVLRFEDFETQVADLPGLQGLLALGFRSGMFVPLLAESGVVGVLNIFRKAPKWIPDAQVRVAETFADQAVIAIENTRLFDETQAALEHQTAAAEILEVINRSSNDIQPVFDAIAEKAMNLCHAQIGAVSRFDGELVHLVAYRGAAPETYQAVSEIFPQPPNGSLPLARAVSERRAIQSEDVLNESGFSEYELGIARRLGVRSYLGIPLMRDGDCIGSIAVARNEPGYFNSAIVRLLETFAEQAVTAIENARLFNETQETLERQTATADILKVISASPTDTQPVFDAIAKRAQALSQSRGAVVTLVKDDQLFAVGVAGMTDEEASRIRSIYPVDLDSTDASCRAIRKRKPVQLSNDEMAPGNELLVKQLLAVPMSRDGTTIGSIAVGREQHGAYAEGIVALLQTFADQAVIAIANTRLFNETQEALDRQTATADILKVISASLTDVQPVFDAIAEQAKLLTGAKFGFAGRYDGELLHLAAFSGSSPEEEAEMAAVYPVTIEGQMSVARSIRAGAPAQSPDVLDDATYLGKDAARRLGYQATLGVPMMRGDECIGAIGVARETPGEFPEKQVRLLQTFAAQAVIAFENARLFDETRDALAQQTAISDILQITTESPSDAQPMLNAIALHAAELCEAAAASIFLVEDNKLKHAASQGEYAYQPRSVEPFEIDRSSTSGRAILDHRIVNLPDAQNEKENYPFAAEIAEQYGFHSLIAAPLNSDKTEVGTIILWRREIRPFGARESTLLRTFGDQAAIALASVKLFKETREALEQQTATAEILRVISSSPTALDPVFDAISIRAKALCDADTSGVLLYDGELITASVVHGMSAEQEAGLRDLYPMKAEPTLVSSRAILERRPIQVPDLDVDPDYRSIEQVQKAGLRSALAVPLLKEESCIGALVVMRKTAGVFPQKLVSLFKTFADQAVIAIENVRLFKEIQDKSRELEVANTHKSEFLANMSHELRTPLNAVIGFSEVLLEGMFGELNEKQDDYLHDIHNSGKHLLSLINDILDLSKVEAGRMELELEDFDVAGALDNTLTLIRERAQQHGIKLIREFSEDIGEHRADQRKFKQIMLNLLSNAVKFTPDGGTITVAARMLRGELEVAVSDTGIGISEEDQAGVFDEFRQVSGSYTNKSEGTGLGLTLTQRFVELHGGTIRVASELDQGSTFTFTLPKQT